MGKNNDTSDVFHELLFKIVQDFGEEILLDSRLKSIVNDLSAGSKADRFQPIIGRSINSHIGERILQCRDLDEADFSLRINTIKQTFQEENFLRHGISDYIIDCYLYALGWIDHLDEYDEAQETSQKTAKAGVLSFIERNGEEYCGNLSKDDQRSGFGISKYDDGSYFAGEWKLNLKNGIGMEVSASRAKYAGEWRMNRKNGVGIALLDDGTRYSGEWKNGKVHGLGTLHYPNGERMCANFSSGEINKETGIYYLKDGSCIVGLMTLKGPDGTCLHFMKNGTYEIENWMNGTKK